jgi:hypothetical protein
VLRLGGPTAATPELNGFKDKEVFWVESCFFNAEKAF